MRIAGTVAFCNHPLWQQTLNQMLDICDVVYARFDVANGDPEILQKLKLLKERNPKLKGITIVQDRWSCPEWREQCYQMIKEPVDIVLCPDEDELFDDGIMEELKEFFLSDKKGMMFSYQPMEAKDGRLIHDGEPYPLRPHMKAYKWAEGLSYYPYHGDAKIARYQNEDRQWFARTKIRHFCAWTKAMERDKNWRQNKVVTIIGFGPSSGKDMQISGEVWSMNDCYQVFTPEIRKLTTRVFEMHMVEKRDRMMARDGKSHFCHLDEMGRQGVRVIMQSPHPQITGSEAYPLHAMMSKYPKFFTGTVSYMLAMAIDEGFTEIRIYGLDQMDWEHILQRESFVFWCALALGKGIVMSGQLTFFERAPRLYGYDHGPEFDAECERELWAGFPFQIHSKVESRAVVGDLFGNR